MDKHCNAHEEFLVAVTKLTTQVESMRTIFKWMITTMVSIALTFAGISATFLYKTGDLYAQVQVHDAKIAENTRRINNYESFSDLQ